VVGIRVKGAIEPEAGEECKGRYREGEGKEAARGRALTGGVRHGSAASIVTIVRGLGARTGDRTATCVLGGTGRKGLVNLCCGKGTRMVGDNSVYLKE
jgi:hypothetical protein